MPEDVAARQMRPPNTVVSFVSGKGGVGKTSLAVNFAWLCSLTGKTLLIDLDFQNQGCTGVFLTKLPPNTLGMLEQLQGIREEARCEVVEIDKDFFLIPSASPDRGSVYGTLAAVLQNPGLGASVRAHLELLADKHGFQNIVLDCHGGLDYASVAAYHVSNHTIVVTEADTVTFNGTLELLDFYDAHQHTPSESRLPATSAGGPARPPSVSFILNRVPPKYQYRDINATFKRLIANYEGSVKVDPEVLLFVPEETLVAESFGEYPFCARIAPKSVFACKLQLLAFDLLPAESTATAQYPQFRKMRKSRYRKAVRERMLSAESRNIGNIVSAFGWLSTAFGLALIVYFVSLVALLTTGKLDNPNSTVPAIFRSFAIRIPIAVAALVCVLYVIRAEFGLMFYYNDTYRFRREMLRAVGGPANMWQKLSMFKLWVLRLGNSVGPVLIALIALTYAVLAVIVLFLPGTFFGS